MANQPQDVAAFLDLMAECFDRSLAVWHGTPCLDPSNNQPITAGELLERIRLHKYPEVPRAN